MTEDGERVAVAAADPWRLVLGDLHAAQTGAG
jgi:hypothetical protein